MERQQTQNYQMLTRVVDYGIKNESLFPRTSAGVEIVESLRSSVARLSEQSIAQVSSEAAIEKSRARRTAARTTLKKMVEAAVETARVLGHVTFQPPANKSDPALIDSGRALALAAAPMEKEFAKHGLPHITEDLIAAVENLELAILEYTTAKAARASAIREYGKAMKEAMRELQRFEILVSNTLSDNPTAIASWETARYVSRNTGRRKAAPDREVDPSKAA